MRYLFALLLLTSVASAQEDSNVLYCSDENSNGFQGKPDQKPEPTMFNPRRHTLKFTSEYEIIIKTGSDPEQKLICDRRFETEGEGENYIQRCGNLYMTLFYNPANKRYTIAAQTAWILDAPFDTFTSYGSCAEF